MVTIIIVPAGVMQKRLSDIYFLGSLLDKKSFKHEFRNIGNLPGGGEQRARAKPVLEGRPAFPVKRVNPGREKGASLKRLYGLDDIDSVIETEKLLPAQAEREYLYEGPGDRLLEISGGAKDRLVLFKPPLPDYKTAVSINQQDSILSTSYKVQLKLLITADGTVKSADILQTSGYPDIDLIAERYVKKWKFIPLKPDEPQNNQEGVVQIEFGPGAS